MKHNYIKLMLPVLLCIVSLSASAHDFEVGGIYYNITSSTDLTVAVTFRGGYYSDYYNEYSGQVSIPETVAYNEKTYRVTSIGSFKRFTIKFNTIEWENGADFAPEYLYEIGVAA